MLTFGKADGLFVPRVFTWNSTQFDGICPVAGMWVPRAAGPQNTNTIENNNNAVVRPARFNRQRFVIMYIPLQLRGSVSPVASPGPR
jgi:hypothetical protein